MSKRRRGGGVLVCLSFCLWIFYLYSFLSSSSGYVRALGGGEGWRKKKRLISESFFLSVWVVSVVCARDEREREVGDLQNASMIRT